MDASDSMLVVRLPCPSVDGLAEWMEQWSNESLASKWMIVIE